MKKVFLRILSMIFALLMVLSAISCKNKDNTDEAGNNSAAGDTNVVYPDMAGYEFVVLTEDCDFQHTAFDYDEYSGNVIDNALYTRNSLMEQDYNIVISEKTQEIGKANEAIKNDILFPEIN